MLNCLHLSGQGRIPAGAAGYSKAKALRYIPTRSSLNLKLKVQISAWRDVDLGALIRNCWIPSIWEQLELRNGVFGFLLPGHCTKHSRILQNEQRSLGVVPRRISLLLTYALIQDTMNTPGQRGGGCISPSSLFFHGHFVDIRQQPQGKSLWVATKEVDVSWKLLWNDDDGHYRKLFSTETAHAHAKKGGGRSLFLTPTSTRSQHLGVK